MNIQKNRREKYKERQRENAYTNIETNKNQQREVTE